MKLIVKTISKKELLILIATSMEITSYGFDLYEKLKMLFFG